MNAVDDRPAQAIVVTGATGFLGSLVAANALQETDATVILPVRDHHTREDVRARIAAELRAEGHSPGDADLDRLVIMPLSELGFGDLPTALRESRTTDILHCAGCLSYFNSTKLEAGNLELTSTMLRLGTRLGARRFVYLSTAYSSGFVDGPIREALHDEPGTDPTDYTRTKREAERLVAESGLPFLIVRPSIVVGDSRDGRYDGKPYGVYQLWAATERYWADRFPAVLHVVAAQKPINFLHQDAFTAGFWAAYQQLPDGTVMHLVSRDDGLPTMRQLWELWLSTYGGPEEVHLHRRLADVPVNEIDDQMRLWLDFTAVNNEIASVRWQFETQTLERLRQDGLAMTDTTLATIEVAQRRFFDDSPKLQRFVARNRARSARRPRFVTYADASTYAIGAGAPVRAGGR